MDIAEGSVVTIRRDAVYGGLATSRGAWVPGYITGPTRHYTVEKIATHRGVVEALLGELMSWVAIASLVVV